MPQLPKYGWLFKCEECEIITSRLTTIKHKRKTRTIHVCLTCRPKFIGYLLSDFNTVIVKEETVSQQIILVLD